MGRRERKGERAGLEESGERREQQAAEIKNQDKRISACFLPSRRLYVF